MRSLPELRAYVGDYLKEEIFNVKPKVIITVGDTVTSQFLHYTYFREVVDKGHTISLNNETIVIYPIYHPSNLSKEIDIKIKYHTSFNNIAKLYKAFINPNYYYNELLFN